MQNNREQSQTSCQTLNRDALLLNYTDTGYILTPLKGKIPLVKDWVKTEYDPLLSPEDIKGNYGVVLQDDDIIVDVDPRNFPKGENSLTRLIEDLGIPKTDFATFTVKTGGGGLHLYFKKPKDLKIRGSLKEYKGIEFKTKGQQIVGAGSIHPETQKAYEVKRLPFAPVQAPQALLNLIERQDIELADNKPQVYTDSEQNVLRYIKFLQSCPPAIEGEGGDVLTFKTACRGRDFALSPAKTFECMAEYYNPRCTPVWNIEDLKKKVDNAYSYNYDVIGKHTAESDFEKVLTLEEETIGEHEEELKWDVTKNNDIKPTIRNVVNYLLCKEYPLLGILQYNEFTGDIVFVKPSPWHNGKKLGTWTDSDAIQFKYWLSRVRGFNVSTPLCQEAIIIAAEKFKYHPVREYLKTLEWDGVPRIDTWLNKYAGVEDNPYTRAVACKTLVGAVARVFNPGCKFDQMLVLEGEQGIGKSTLISILGGEWYGDVSITDTDKDTIDAMRGCWIVEVSEMVCSRKVEADKLKSFLSKATDRVRLAYRRNAEDYPRQSIFIGTINPEDNGYLKDPTGNRRFWPVYCTKVDFNGLKADRDQLWAEAVSRYFKGEKLFLDKKEIQIMAHTETEKRMFKDPWLDVIEEWMNRKDSETGKLRYVVTSKEILEECIGLSISRVGQRELSRISNIMCKELNCEKGKFYQAKTGKTVRGYRRKTVDLAELGLE